VINIQKPSNPIFMKTIKPYLLTVAVIAFSVNLQAQQINEDLINLLIQKQVISQNDADSIRVVNAIKALQAKEKQTKYTPLTGVPLTLNGYTQVRFQSQQEEGKPDYLDIRRARLDFKGVVDEHWDYRLQLEFAGSPKILDAVISYKHRNWLKFSAGQFKIPFSAENLTSSNKTESIDRSQVVEALAARSKDVIGNQNGRDLGIQVNGSILKVKDRYIIDYAFGGFNGAGINTADNNEPKDFVARILLHPFKNVDFGGSYYNGYGKWGGPAKEQVRLRYATELSFTYAIASIKGEYILGQDGTVKKGGWFAQAGAYIYKKSVQLIARYDTFDPNTDTAKKDDSSTNYIFGVNLNFNSWAKLQVNYTYKDEEGKAVNNDLVVAQLQLGF